MSVENLYSYLEYLNLAIDQLDEAVTAREQEAAELRNQLEFADRSLMDARLEIDRLHAQMQVNRQQADTHIQQLEAQLMAQAAQPQAAAPHPQPVKIRPQPTTPPSAKAAPQDDLFGGWTGPAKSKIANDQNALILAKKLDSTIDKVQRLIGQGK